MKKSASDFILDGLKDSLYNIANPQDDDVGKALAHKRIRMRANNSIVSITVFFISAIIKTIC